MRRARLLSVAAITCASIQGAAAETRLFVLDGFNAALTFSCDVIGMVPVEGAFTRFVAVIALDANAPGEARAVVRVDADSIAMSQQILAGKLKGPDFFDVARHPEFDFTSYGTTVLAPGHLRMEGELSLKGLTRPFALDIRYEMEAPGEASLATIEAVGSLDRTEFGMTAYDLFLSDAVSIAVEGKMDRSVGPGLPNLPGG